MRAGVYLFAACGMHFSGKDENTAQKNAFRRAPFLFRGTGVTKREDTGYPDTACLAISGWPEMAEHVCWFLVWPEMVKL